MPRISILTPFFNPGVDFAETVESVRSQTWTDWEWIIIDDASTDAVSREALRQTVASDDRIRLFGFDENRGLCAARNKGIENAQGEFLLFLDADDILEPTFAEKCLWRLLTRPEWAFTKGYTRGFGAKEFVWRNGFHEGARFLQENRVCPTSMVRTEAARSVEGFDETMRDGLEDWDFWLRLARAGYWGGTVPEVLDHYRMRQDHSGRWKNLQEGRREQFEASLRARFRDLRLDAFTTASEKRRSPDEWLRELSLPTEPAQPRQRVWMILPHLELGGADRLNLDLLRHWRTTLNYEVVVITTRDSADSWSAEFRKETPLLYCLPRFLPPEAYFAFLHTLAEVRPPAAVYLSHSEVGYLLLPWLRQHLPSVPFWDLVHIPMESWKEGGYPRFSIDYGSYLDGTIATSEWLKRWMTIRGAPAEPIKVVYTGIDPAHWPFRSCQSQEGPARLLFAGRFTEQKNPRILPAVLEQLDSRGLAYHLTVAGEGPDQHWLEEHVFSHSRVSYVGPVSPEHMQELMAQAEILLLPSASEGVALVLFEAMSLGVAVVATDVGGQCELVTPNCGDLLPLGDDLPKRLADCIERLVSDHSFRSARVNAARARIEANFTFARTAAQTSALLFERRSRVPSPSASPALDLDAISKAVRSVDSGTVRQDEWAAAIARGASLAKVASVMASWARDVPGFGIYFRRWERRWGERMGRALLNVSRRRRS